MKKTILFLFSILLLASCATTNQYVKFPYNTDNISPGFARVYIIRPTNFGSAIKMPVFCNEKLIGKTGPKSYLCWEIKEGENLINSTAENSDEIRINAKSGKTYYIKQAPKLGVVVARVSLELLDEDKGKSLVSKLKKPKVKYIE